MRAGREHHNPRLVLLPRRKAHKGVLHVTEEAGEAVNVMVAKRFGQDARGGEAVGESVAGARRNLRAVGDDPPLAVGGASQIGGVEMQERICCRPDVVAGTQEIRLRKDQRGREPAGTNEFLRAVAVRKNPIEQRRALD